MLLFLISCLSFVFLSKSFKPLPQWTTETRLLYICSWRELLYLINFIISTSFTFGISSVMSFKKRFLRSKLIKDVEENHMNLLDLPELAIDNILEKLQPNELCKMSEVCRSLRDRCDSDYLWDKHMKDKWGALMGLSAHREWEWHISKINDSFTKKKKGLFKSLSCSCTMSWGKPKGKRGKLRNPLPLESSKSWYLCLENGKFWFPAQVYNRENGHVGFMLSCYDAQLCYDSFTDTFQARYLPHGPRAPVIEEYVPWERVRAPPVDNLPRNLHASDCLDDLHPGDHVEIQWRRNKEFPYGWWYGVVGHQETCDKNAHLCRCHDSDTVILEFNQYSPGSRWRTTTVSRKDHREEGNEAEGFYGGIRKIYSKEEISVWKNLWPKQTLG